jgi:hypothetical protein
MQVKTNDLIDELTDLCNQHIDKAEKLKTKSDITLNWKAHNESWSILECIEHLNLYGNFYIPAIQRAITNNQTLPDEIFKSGILGNYFAKSMLPKEKLNKMKTFKDKNPINSNLDKRVIDNFLAQEIQLIHLLEQSKKINLTKTKTNISISKWIKLRLGDTFRFVTNHNIRHFKQIDKIFTQLEK